MLTPEQLGGKIVTGEFVNKQEPEFVSEYQTLIDQYRQEAGE